MINQQVVIVEHREGGDWALVLTAARLESGRCQISAYIMVNPDGGVFAICPHLKEWVRDGHIRTYSPLPEYRATMLKEALASTVKFIVKNSDYVCEHTRVALTAKRGKALTAEFAPIPGFEFDEQTEPAFYWLRSRSEVAEGALTGLREYIKKYFPQEGQQ